MGLPFGFWFAVTKGRKSHARTTAQSSHVCPCRCPGPRFITQTCAICVFHTLKDNWKSSIKLQQAFLFFLLLSKITVKKIIATIPEFSNQISFPAKWLPDFGLNASNAGSWSAMVWGRHVVERASLVTWSHSAVFFSTVSPACAKSRQWRKMTPLFVASRACWFLEMWLLV